MTSPTITLIESLALRAWFRRYGRTWKAELRQAWMSGRYPGVMAHDVSLLQGLRNRLGPSWLAKYTLPPID